MAKNFPIFTYDNNTQIQETQWTLESINSKKKTPRHLIVKRLRSKDK